MMPHVPAKKKPLPVLASPPMALPVPAALPSPLPLDSLEARIERFLHPVFWHESGKGNPTRRIGNLRVTIYHQWAKTEKHRGWLFCVHSPNGGEHYSKDKHDSPEDAKRAAAEWCCEQGYA